MNDDFLEQAGADRAPLAAQCAYAKISAIITGDKEAAAKLLSACNLEETSHTLEDCMAAYKWLQEEPAVKAAADQFFTKAQAVCKWSSVFNGRNRLPLPQQDLCCRIQAVSMENGSLD